MSGNERFRIVELKVVLGESLYDISFEAMTMAKQMDCIVEFKNNEGDSIFVRPFAKMSKIVQAFQGGPGSAYVEVKRKRI